jgi:hypothetical protein
MSGTVAAAETLKIIIDAAVAADMIATLIEKFRLAGVKVTLEDIDAKLTASKIKRQQEMKDAGLI